MELPKIGGVYRHYKGNYYTVTDIVSDCENPERKLIIYRSMENKGWARELSDFTGVVSTDEGTNFYRFELCR